MRLVTYLTENSDEKLIEQFRKDTTQWQKEMGGSRVWRATNNPVKGLLKLQARKNRKPKDTPQEVHEWFDKVFKKFYGWNARSEGVFAATTPNGLNNFGKDIFLVYPCNGYKYLWSEEINDLTDYASKAYSLIDYDGSTGKWFTAWGWDDEKQVSLMEEDIKIAYNNKNLSKASDYATEVMFNCPKGYYMVGHEFFRSYYQLMIGEHD